MNCESNSIDETIAIGKQFAEELKQGDIVCLNGNLGAGKTHFVKGVASFFGVNEAEVNSPTFTLINEYSGTLPIYHFDCYRLKNEQEALEIGAEEYLFGEGVSLIEWPERINSLLPDETIKVELNHAGDSKRIIRILERHNT